MIEQGLRRRLTLAAAVAGSVVAATVGAGTASAAPVQPFAIQPASFGNPNGSFDVPPIHCGLESGPGAGQVTVTGTLSERWGCLPFGRVWWLNTATGATGAARMSAGLNDHPAQAVLHTGRGRIVVTLMAAGGVVTPGFATVDVR
ncbi:MULTISPECIES: hypothetical protein [Gordonia]|uniref:Secreted protein n=2 Tax=Gordonia TaxID=2053 RepID=L7LND6_9ACTN|nr:MULTISPECIES: hypothetical protein [Gordonia]AUH69665.1 hypothetical protein CXX93_16740 [Gordonia sp. YC-JH1]KXT57493.1 hypothetical protein Y710_08650 [Gordonia sp. QH-12]GAC62645.1 hypothetical protein GSI01S_39_00430 [Gordonia sihwensis NBRC 108236]